MKEFEEWFNKMEKGYEGGHWDDDTPYDDCGRAWRAALKWAKDQEFIRDKIYEELED